MQLSQLELSLRDFHNTKAKLVDIYLSVQRWVLSNFESQDQQYCEDMEQLIDPDRANHLIARLERINHKVCTKQNSGSKDGRMCEEHKYSRICGAMIKVYFLTFPLLDTHPGALKGKITDKMAGQPDKQRRYRDIDESGKHGHCLSSTKSALPRV